MGRPSKQTTVKRKRTTPKPTRKGLLPAKAKSLLRRLHGSLSLDLRHPSYPQPNQEDLYYATYTHCYIATEAMYHLWAKNAGYVPYVFKHPNKTTHWWLVQQETGHVLDPTEPQMDGPFEYSKGRRGNFLTVKPSRRAKELMRRMARRP